MTIVSYQQTEKNSVSQTMCNKTYRKFYIIFFFSTKMFNNLTDLIPQIFPQNIILSKWDLFSYNNDS